MPSEAVSTSESTTAPRILATHPVPTVVGLFALFTVASVVIPVVGRVLISAWTDVSFRLVGQFVLLALALGLLAWTGWWREAGFTPRREWRQPWLALPFVAVALVQLVGGVIVEPISLATNVVLSGATAVAFLIVAQLVVGVSEEAFARGFALRALMPRGIVFAVVLSAVLFGLLHSTRVFTGEPAVLVAFQVAFAAVDGFALAALRLRTNTIWLGIAIHALFNFTIGLAPTTTAMRVLLFFSYVALLCYGVYLPRGVETVQTRDETNAGPAAVATPAR